MVICRDIEKMNPDGLKLLAGEAGMNRVGSWTYLIQSRACEKHVNQGNFVIAVCDDIQNGFGDIDRIMEELNTKGISASWRKRSTRRPIRRRKPDTKKTWTGLYIMYRA